MTYLCSACGHRIIIDVLLDDDIWKSISEGDYALCATCIDERLHARSMKANGLAVFFGRRALTTTEITPEIQERIYRWRPQP